MTTPAIATIGHNNPPVDPIDEALTAIQDLYDEAKNFCDGEPIDSEEMHDTITRLYDQLHEAGKAADALRVEAKRPLDEAIKEIQDRFNPFIQPKKGKVDIGKSELGKLLSAWRARIAAEKEAAARKAREEADRIAREAQEAMQASRGNLEEREKAEALVQEAKAVEREAKRADKQATTGTGLRTVWHATLEDAEQALDWGYTRDPAAFVALCQNMADAAVRGGLRVVPGFKVESERVAI